MGVVFTFKSDIEYIDGPLKQISNSKVYTLVPKALKEHLKEGAVLITFEAHIEYIDEILQIHS